MIEQIEWHRQLIPSPEGNIIFGAGKGIIGDESRDMVSVYGDPAGLRWLAKVLQAIADLDQRRIPDENLPPHEGFHTHLRPESECRAMSQEVIVGRLDAKADGSFAWFLPP